MTIDTNSAVESRDDALLAARARVGLRFVFLAIALLMLADVRLAENALRATLAVRAAQFALIGVASVGARIRVRRRVRIVTMVAFVSALYVTSAVAGLLRGAITTQPITDLAIAFATATTLPWGALAQLASVVVAGAAIVVDATVVRGLDTSPHMAVGLAVSFLVSVYIAHQLERYRVERDAAENALRQNEERFRSLIERGSDVITIVDASGIVRYDSPSIERVLGYPPEERVGREAGRYLHPDDHQAVSDAVLTARRGRSPSVECRVARRDGSWCDVEAVFTDLLDHPAIGGIVVNWRDICDRKRADEERARHTAELALARDQALASTRAKSAFLANMSHEIRTPINVVIGLAEMVLDTPLAEDQARNLGRIRTAATGLLGVINDILDASKIEAGKMTIAVVDMDFRGIVDEVVALLAPAAAGKGLALAAIASPELPARVKGDPVRVRQTLLNLVGNAVKFTQAGSVTIETRVLHHTASHVVVRTSVTDTGIGIPPDRQAAIFESFAQADDGIARVYGGTGLGLAISRELVTLMGGRIGLESMPGRGSTFWLELTLQRAGSAAEAA